MMSPFDSAPTFETPIALLIACHDKVRRFANLAARLDEHLAKHGVDGEAKEAAANILRYFDIAAPLHHADEEEDLYPALRALNDEALNLRLCLIESEHEVLDSLWLAVRPWLASIAHGDAPARPDLLQRFIESFPAHANREEVELYPSATRLSESCLSAIGDAMRGRRQIAS